MLVSVTFAVLLLTAPSLSTPSYADANNALAIVNAYRALANLPAVVTTTALNTGSANHSQYMVMNNNPTHVEDPANPWYTPDGAVAGNGNTFAMYPDTAFTDQKAMDFWVGGAFHQLHVIDPRLQQVGYGSFTRATANPTNDIEAAASLNVHNGTLGPAPTAPVMFPANGKTMTLKEFTGNEFPNPFTAPSCAGYAVPTGPAITLQLVTTTPVVTAHSIQRNGVNLNHCWFDETNYTNPDPGTQTSGRQYLANSIGTQGNVTASRHAVVLIPRDPLTDGTYNVSITSNGTTYAWTFFVGNVAPPQRTLTVSRAGTGTGTVTGTGISCGADCTETYNDGTGVTLTATPAVGSTFAGWTGDCAGTGTCTLTMNAAKTATATFNTTTAGTFTATATASPTSVAKGGSSAITATVHSPTAGSFVVDVEVYDPSGNQVFQWYWEDQAFTAGQTRTFQTSWPVPANAATGTYTVRVGVFSGPSWETQHVWNDNAAQVAVGAACSPRPPVRIQTVRGAAGQLQVTITAGQGTLTQIGFGAAANARISVPGGAGGRPGLNASPGNATLNLTDRPTSLTFTVSRFQAGQATHVPITVTDGCSSWPTFVGGGPTAF